MAGLAFEEERAVDLALADVLLADDLPAPDFALVDLDLLAEALVAADLPDAFEPPADALVADALPAPRAPRAALAFSLEGQSMLTQMRHGPRWVTTSTMGAPHSGQVSPRACSSPR